jgi:hypothetical protein
MLANYFVWHDWNLNSDQCAMFDYYLGNHEQQSWRSMLIIEICLSHCFQFVVLVFNFDCPIVPKNMPTS